MIDTVYCTSSDVALFLIIGLSIGLLIVGIYEWISSIERKRKEYTDTLDDKEYRKYSEFRNNL